MKMMKFGFAITAAACILVASNAFAAFVNQAGYHMDEPSGSSIAHDFTGHSHNGALVNVVTGVAGKSGMAFKFNGTNAYMRVPNSTSLKPGSRSINVSFYLKTSGCTKIAPLDCDIVKYGASGDPSPTGVGLAVKVELEHDGSMVCGFSGTNTHYDMHVGGLNVANDAWHKIVCKKTSSAVILVVDGVQRGSHAVSVGSINPVRDLFVGSDGTSGVRDWYNGLLDEVVFAYQ
jgi:hypothetical protein